MSHGQFTDWSAKVEAIYRRDGRELWALLYAQCGDADRAYDALQEAFARLQSQNGTVIRNKRAWLLQVGRNWLRDVARRKTRAARPADYLDELAGTPADPAENLLRTERHDQVRETLKRLRADDREVLVLRYALEWSSQQIADALDTTASAVDMRLSRARRRFAKLHEQAEPGL